MDGRTGDLTDAIGKILSDPEALSKAMKIASALSASGVLDGAAQGREESGRRGGAGAAQTEDAANRSGAESGNAHGNGNGNGNLNVNDLLSALSGGAYRKEEGAYTESAGERLPRPVSENAGDNARRRRLLTALRPYMGNERREVIDKVLRILGLLEAAESLGISGRFL